MRVLVELSTVLMGGWTAIGIGLRWRQRKKRERAENIEQIIRENERLDELLHKKGV